MAKYVNALGRFIHFKVQENTSNTLSLLNYIYPMTIDEKNKNTKPHPPTSNQYLVIKNYNYRWQADKTIQVSHHIHPNRVEEVWVWILWVEGGYGYKKSYSQWIVDRWWVWGLIRPIFTRPAPYLSTPPNTHLLLPIVGLLIPIMY